MAYERSLCWKCKKSCPKAGEKGCSWVENLEPVSGWDAEQHVLPSRGEKYKVSYMVRSCPGFDPDDEAVTQISVEADPLFGIRLTEALLKEEAKIYSSYLKNFEYYKDAATMREVIRHEAVLKRSSIVALIPEPLTYKTYISSMRARYLSKEALRILNEADLTI